MHQQDYIQKILSRYGYETCQPSATPLPPGFHAGPEDEHVGGAPTGPFVSPATKLGELGFPRWTREDVFFAIHVLATALHSWTPKHDRGLARLLRYLERNGQKPPQVLQG